MGETIGVLILTRNRAALLRRCLDSVADQTTPPDEVLVVDNGSTDETPDVVASFQSRLPIRAVYEAKPSIPRARNVALRHATTELALFLDDDCVADPGWVAAAARAAAANPGALLIQGGFKGWASGLAGKAFQLNNEVYLDPRHSADGERETLCYIMAANLLVRRSALAGLTDWFDESLERSSDREFAVRARREGRLVVHDPQMVVTHDYDSPSFPALCRKFFERAKGRAALPSDASPWQAEGRATLARFREIGRRLQADRTTPSFGKLTIVLLNGIFYLASGLGYAYWSLRRLFAGWAPHGGGRATS
jgi:glycosyltransferase involved in cell wall biosynthesis